MPIKYQMLGGGGGTDLLLKVAPNISVTLSKGTYTQTLTANEQGQALFKNLSNGTYTATAQGTDGVRYQKEILVDDVQEEVFVVAKIKDLPLKSKIRLSDGKTFILQAKNAENHPKNSATFISEYIIEDFEWADDNYGANHYGAYKKLKSIFEKHLENLSAYERQSVLLFNADGQEIGTEEPTVPSHFYFLSYFELGVNENGNAFGPDDFSDGEYYGRNLGFSSNADRTKKYQSGKAGTYFLRNSNVWNSSLTIWYVDETGKVKSDYFFEHDTLTCGVVLACDISGDTTVYLDTDGYYRVTDK